MSKFDIKDRLDAMLYSAYNIISDVIYRLDFASKILVRRNKAFKNIHDGGRCFILGTGPSLRTVTDSQVERLKSEVLFAVNSFYKSDFASILTPRYYTLIDNLYWEGLSHTFAEVVKKYAADPPVFITDPRARDFISSLSLGKDPIYIYSKKYPVQKMSSELHKNIYAAMNCISYSILAAIYMGFKEVYLLGTDYNAFCSAGAGHCYDDKDEHRENLYNLAFYLKFYWITTEFHYLIAKLAKEAGVRVVNLAPGSLLDAYPRRPISEVI